MPQKATERELKFLIAGTFLRKFAGLQPAALLEKGQPR